MYFRTMEASSESRTEQRLLDASLVLLVAYNVLTLGRFKSCIAGCQRK